MTTNNPKISAYVPQVIYERFKQFQEERGLSMSQAAIELFATYFGVSLLGDSTQQSTGGLLDRINQLEEKIAFLSNLPSGLDSSLLAKVDFLSNQFLGIERRLAAIEQLSVAQPLIQDEINPKYEQLSFTETELPGDEIEVGQVVDIEDSNSQLRNDSTSQTNLLKFKQIDEPESLLNDLKHFLPLHTKVLAARLSCGHSTIGIYTKSKDSDEFAKWAASKDLSNIRWKLAEGAGTRKYVPDGELSSVQKSELLGWLQEYSFKEPKSDEVVLITDEQDTEAATKLNTDKVLPLSGRALAARLSVSAGEVSKYKLHHPSSFLEWSRKHDPDHLGWKYSEELAKYVPVVSTGSHL